MTLQIPSVRDGDWTRLRIIIDKLKHLRLGVNSSPTFTGLTLSGLTQNSVLFAGANGVISQDNTNLSWNDSTNILTASGVTVTNAAVIGSNSVVFQPDTDSTTFFQILDKDGGRPILNIDSTNERIGFGTAVPGYIVDVRGIDASAQLHFSSSDVDSGGYLVSASANNFFMSSGAAYNGSDWIAKSTDSTIIGGGSTGFRFYVDSGLTIGNSFVPTSLMTVAPSGNIGVSTMNPAKKLSVIGAIASGEADAGDTDGRVAMAWDAANDRAYLNAFQSGYKDFRIDGLPLVLNTFSGGNVGINEVAPETLTEWTSTSPYLTLHNSTEEDSDGGRESRINFKGEQTGTEETTLARIEVSHDGSADDEKGKIIFSTNDGSDSDTPTDHIKIDAAGNTYIGDGGTSGNYTKIEPGGTIEFNGTATVWKDINIGAGTLSGPPGKQPGIVNFVDEVGADTGIATYGLAVGEGLSGLFEIQHDYKEGSDITFHVHFQGIAAPTGTDKVQFQLTYTVTSEKINETLDAVTVITAESDFDTQYESITISFNAITGTNLEIGDQFLFTLERIAASANEYGGEALLQTIGIHYEMDTVGSRTRTTK